MRELGRKLVRWMLREGLLTPEDLQLPSSETTTRRERHALLEDLGGLFRKAGVRNDRTGAIVELKECPFSDDEIKMYAEMNWTILCVPRGVSAKALASAFGLTTWATDDQLVSRNMDSEDDWFATPKTLEPDHVNKSAIQVSRILEEEELYGFSLRRYLVFLAAMKELHGLAADRRWWTWLLRTKYDRSGLLIAGIDQNERLSVHGWMRNFNAKYVGVRYCKLPALPLGASRTKNVVKSVFSQQPA